ncbi:mind the gap isoform X2 [Anticarsia gemmatalis]|uniref:mind the gap isoform X2 n=1 Tax=Anticarsia gemmatalis TaxID=129554 RepID=UPI003F774FAE
MKATVLLGGCLVLLAVLIEIAHPTCVLESDFGFKINCAFKKSGLFRVRNLGGVKAHASIGFSLGDELGFEQSLTNLDPSRRRSVSVRNGAPANVLAARPAKQEKRGKQNRIMRPVAPVNRPNQAAMDKLTSLHRRVSTTMQPIIVQAPVEQTIAKPVPTVTMAKPMPMGVPPFKPLPPKDEKLAVIPIQATRKTYTPLQIPQSKGPGLAYQNPVPHQVHDLAVYNTKKVDDYNSITGYGDDTVLKINKEDINAKIAEIAKAGNISMEAVEAAIALRQQQLLSKYANIPVPTAKPTTTTTTTTTEQPQPFVFQPEPEPEILTAALPQKPKRVPVAGKVMNAPREYYPVGYEKNFDDHFQSKVELPETNFHCGDQKYFPGLYGDESLGCMVFHVCALTDDGLVMKSFLCPESTLFDQTILKCNWWFYVDCKNTKKLYDTNIPVSKSYQLMKALTFFSSYKKEMQDGQQKPNPEEVDGIKEAISILQNAQPNAQANQPQPSIANIGNGANNVANVGSNANIQTVQFVTPTPLIDERSRQTTTESAPVYRGTRNYDATKNKNTTSAENVQDIKLITVNADINIQNNTENDSREKKHRRRMTLKSTNTITKATTQKPVPSIVEVIKQEIQPIESLPKQEKLTDQIENLNPNTANLAPVRRFYRSSAEKFEEKEMAVVNNEKVQIVRPTAQTRLVGEYPTPSAVIAKLDEAILGKVRTRKHITIVMPLDSPKT